MINYQKRQFYLNNQTSQQSNNFKNQNKNNLNLRNKMSLIPNKLNHKAKTQTRIQPMTQLYLRQFFANHYLKTSQKQAENMYQNSIEVLDCLVTQYVDKFGLQLEGSQSQNADVLSFQTIYDKLAVVFNILMGKLENCQSSTRRIVKSQNCHKQQNYNDYLFPQNQSLASQNVKTNEKLSPSTDQELYLLVVDLKRQNKQKSKKISDLTKQLKEKQDALVKLEISHKNLEQIVKKSEVTISNLSSQTKKVTTLKEQLQNRLETMNKKFDELTLIYQRSEALLLLKDQKIKNLQFFEKTHALNLVEINQVKGKLITASESLEKLMKEKICAEQERNILIQREKIILSENKKLKEIISKKLYWISQRKLNQPKQNQVMNDKENISQNIADEKQNEYLVSKIKNILSKQNLINKSIQKQITNFVSNFLKLQTLRKSPKLLI